MSMDKNHTLSLVPLVKMCDALPPVGNLSLAKEIVFDYFLKCFHPALAKG